MGHYCFRPFVTPQLPRAHLPVVIPGEPIPSEPGCLRGHGTMLRPDGTLVASVAGVVERVNKLVSARPLHSRYHGEVGDVVVCRVAEVGQRRWKVDVNARQDAVLMLSSINLPGGVQRRRTAEDQLNMRQFYVENDLLSAEVQAFFQDGAMSVHTRSLKYGKLKGGVLVHVAPSLMKRLKQHFHRFDFGVSAIFGMNGNVWVYCTPPGAIETDELNDVAMPIATEEGDLGHAEYVPTAEERERVCRVRNCLVALDAAYIAVSPTSVQAAYDASVKAGVGVREMLLPEVRLQICQTLLEHTAGENDRSSRAMGAHASYDGPGQ
mmetsp:Transcript_5104/g.9875  ORF Transcript_5104/g.9875 Transcript_5104/m.9875 type:complete len:322 (-) Transcript_5104:77-1042(-)